MIIRRCVPESEQCKIVNECHASPYRGHFSRERTAHKILQSDFIGPLSSETVPNGSNYVIDAKRLEISAAEMKCPYGAYWRCKFFMYGG